MTLPDMPLPTKADAGWSVEELNEWKDSWETWREETYKRFSDFSSKYKEKINPLKKAAIAAGTSNIINSEGYPTQYTTGELEKCLEFAWAFYVSYKNRATLKLDDLFDKENNILTEKGEKLFNEHLLEYAAQRGIH